MYMLLALSERDLLHLIVFMKIQIPYTNYIKLKILHHHFCGLKPYTIAQVLESEGIKLSRFGIQKFIIMYTYMYNKTGSIGRHPGSGCISKMTSHVKTLVEEQMQQDDEMTVYQLHQMLLEHGVHISFRTVLCCGRVLGWTFCGSAFCQLTRKKTRQSVWSGVSDTRTASMTWSGLMNW